MAALHDTGDPTCPRCGTSLADLEGTVKAESTPPDEQLQVDIHCPACEAPLALIVESALPDALGVDVWVEDRREGTLDD